MQKKLFVPLLAALLLPAAPAWAAKGIVEITSDPGGAKVFINGKRKGTTPTQSGKGLALELKEGEYKVEAKTDNGMTAKQSVFVPANGIQPVHLDIGTSVTVAGRTYLVYANGTALDTKTKLMWMRCVVGQSWTGSTCSGKGTYFKWEAARQQTASFAGHNDWRVPTIEELRTLTYCSNGKPAYFNNGKPGEDEYKAQGRPSGFDWGCRGKAGKDHEKPTIVQSVFPNAPSSFVWSGSPLAYNSNSAWGVHFSFGNVNDDFRDGGNHVRLVRGGQ